MAKRKSSPVDLEKFRLRNFVDKLIAAGEVEIHDQAVALADMSAIIEATDKAVLFRRAGPQQSEVIAAVSGSRRRLAQAFGVSLENLIEEYQSRLASPQPVLEVSSAEAPVHQVVLEGDAVDLGKLPFHTQHEFDGGPYMTSGIDYAVDPETGLTNVGCRRLMLRNRNTLGFNLTAPSDLHRIYLGCVERGERLPVAFAIGSHPLDFMAAGMRIAADEVTLVATLRGEALPLVKCLTNDVRVPADVEMVFEGYFDEHGYREPEGPYGEFMGYYGPMHMDPLFHVTAITMREDVLYQSILHGSGRILDRTDSANMGALRSEATAMKILKQTVREPVAVCSTMTAGGGQHLRVAIRQHAPGEARKAINAIFGAMMPVKHIFVVDEDIDVFDNDQMDWAMSGRFQADKDLVVQTGMMGMHMDPSLDGNRTGAKAGFDLTKPFGRRDAVTGRVPQAPVYDTPARYQTVRQALAAGPLYFSHIMAALGSRDGREIALELDAIRNQGKLIRLTDGQYAIATGDEDEITRKPGGEIEMTGLATPDFKPGAG